MLKVSLLRWLEFWLIMTLALVGTIAWSLHYYPDWNGRIAILIIVLAVIGIVLATVFYFYKKPDSTDNKDRSANDNHQPSADAPPQNNNSNVNASETRNSQKEGEENSRRYRETLTVIGLYFAGSLAVLQWYEMSAVYVPIQEQATAATKGIIALLPPRLIFNEVFIEIKGQDEITSFQPGTKITGSVSSINTGKGPLLIKDNFCMPYWRIGKLPMMRPFQIADRNIIKEKCVGPVVATRIQDGREVQVGLINDRRMESGDIFPWKFETIVPPNYTDAMKLYILGFVTYNDTLGTRRATLMARYYDFTERRFMPEKDYPLYEGEE